MIMGLTHSWVEIIHGYSSGGNPLWFVTKTDQQCVQWSWDIIWIGHHLVCTNQLTNKLVITKNDQQSTGIMSPIIIYKNCRGDSPIIIYNNCRGDSSGLVGWYQYAWSPVHLCNGIQWPEPILHDLQGEKLPYNPASAKFISGGHPPSELQGMLSPSEWNEHSPHELPWEYPFPQEKTRQAPVSSCIFSYSYGFLPCQSGNLSD